MQGINDVYVHTAKRPGGKPHPFNITNHDLISHMKIKAAVKRIVARFSAGSKVFSLPLNFLVTKVNKNHTPKKR